MEDRIVRINGADTHDTMTDIEERENADLTNNVRNQGSIAETIDSVTKLAKEIGKTIEPGNEISEASEHAEGEGYKQRNQIIANSPHMDDYQKLMASYENDRFKLDEKRHEVELQNSIRDNKAKNCSRILWGIAGACTAIGGLFLGYVKLSELLDKDDDD